VTDITGLVMYTPAVADDRRDDVGGRDDQA
jgi:hypothetical protein